MYALQAFVEIQAFPEMPGFSSIAWAFAENDMYLTMLKFWEMCAQYQLKNYFKTDTAQ